VVLISAVFSKLKDIIYSIREFLIPVTSRCMSSAGYFEVTESQVHVNVVISWKRCDMESLLLARVNLPTKFKFFVSTRHSIRKFLSPQKLEGQTSHHVVAAIHGFVNKSGEI